MEATQRRRRAAIAAACAALMAVVLVAAVSEEHGAELASARQSGLDYRPPPPVPHPPGWGSTDLPVRKAPPSEKAAAARNELRAQQQQQLRAEERNWGERIQALAGKPRQQGAARLQGLSEVGAPAPGKDYAVLTAAGRTQSLAAAKAADDYDARVGKVELKYHELVKEQKEDTKLKEQKVNEIYNKEMAILAAAGHKEDKRLRRDEENAETTILAQKKEMELRRELAAVQAAAVAKARRLERKLNAAHALELKYKQVVGQDKLPQGEQTDLPADQTAEMGGSNSTNSSSVLGRAFTRELDQITHVARKQAEAAKEKEERIAAAAKARARAAEKAEQAKEAEAKRQQEVVREEEQEAADKARRAQEHAAAAKKAAELLRKEEARKVRCTEDNCPLDTMDKVMVVDGSSIHQMEKQAESGHGMAKSQALAMIEKLREKIKNDFNQVTGFATHQEHILDVKKVSKDTAFMLGQQVALSFTTDHSSGSGEKL